MTTRAVRDNDLFREIAAILGKEYEIPIRKGYGGSQGPGRFLEDLLHVEANNQDLPDAGRWELKYTSSNSYLTLFHKDPENSPKIIDKMVMAYGWPSKGNTSFRHTIWGTSPRGFRVAVDDEHVSVLNDRNPEVTYRWSRDELSNHAVPKLRNLILVPGRIRMDDGRRFVTYHCAQVNHGFKLSKFMSGLRDGWLAIDFDARTNPPNKDGAMSIRNHGTKFRVRIKDLGKMYEKTYSITSDEQSTLA